ncbi:MAG: hypothetical protein IKU30_08285 [Clostridia bacterium]|nr:hypothetical protein [Clostridia bacterium]
MKEKLKGFLSAVKRNITVTASVAAVFLVIIILVAVFSEAEEASTAKEFNWGDGITEGICAFTGENERLDADENGKYAAAYYTNVTGESVDGYIARLESELNIQFGENGYPRVADCGERLIAVHYSVTEMTLSVTVTAKGDNAIYTENTQSGEQE